MLPQRQRGPVRLTLMWPISPALWSCPRTRRPSRIRPAPIPVPMATVTSEAAPRPSPNVHSPRVSAFTSLSTKTGCPLRSWMSAASGTSPSSASQANASERMDPLSTSTRPGRPTPIPDTRRPRSAAAERARSISMKIVSTAPRPPWVGAWAATSTVPSRSTSPAEIVEAPTSTPTTGSLRIIMRPPQRKACASAETRSISRSTRRGLQGDLAEPALPRGKSPSTQGARPAS